MSRLVLRSALEAAALLVVTSGAASAAPPPEKLAVCLGCHGQDGTSQTDGVPSLGGMPAAYVVTQLFQFREKQRTSPPMNDMAADLSDDDLQVYADAIAALPPPKPSAKPIDESRKARAESLVAKHQCGSCHGSDLAGRDQIPRIRGQREEYLAAALTGYKSNSRPGYDPAMNEVAQTLSDDDIRDLALYVSNQ